MAGVSNTSALIAGGGPTASAAVESWNGTSWTETTEINTARWSLGGNGTQTSMLVYGGEEPAPSSKTESWNGSSWTEVNDLSAGKYGNGAFGSNNLQAIYAGGVSPPATVVATAEEWNVPITNSTLTVS